MSIKRRISNLEKLIPPKPEPDPWKDTLFRMVDIIYDENLSEEEAMRAADALEWPAPTTQYAREMERQFLTLYGEKEPDEPNSSSELSGIGNLRSL